MKDKNTNENVDVVIYTNKDVNNFDLNDVIMLRSNDRLVIITLIFFSFKILKNNNKITLKKKRQLYLSI